MMHIIEFALELQNYLLNFKFLTSKINERNEETKIEIMQLKNYENR